MIIVVAYRYYSLGKVVIKCNDNYIVIRTRSINRFNAQVYKLFIFDNYDEFLSYKNNMNIKYNIDDYKWEKIGRFIFNNACILDNTCGNDFKNGNSFLILNGDYIIYVRFGYAYFIKNKIFNG